MATLKVPAIRLTEGGAQMFAFAVDAKKVHDFARVAHLGEDEEGNVTGFQREEVRAHVRDITAYINREGAFIPNAVVLGFHGYRAPKYSPIERGSALGELSIGYTEDSKPAFVVDGQQRLAAARDSTKESFTVVVVAFIAESEAQLKEQFARVNSAKPLKKAVLHALLPGIEAELNSRLEKDRLAVVLIDRLNRDEDSPFRGRIKTAIHKEGYIAAGTLERAIKDSWANGYLFTLRKSEGVEEMVQVLKNYWNAVATVFADAWDLPPDQQRITQTAGILGLSHLMDQIGDDEPVNKLTTQAFSRVLRKLKPLCHWVDDGGEWDLGPDGRRPWNGIEGTQRGASMLKNLFAREYRKLLKGSGGGDAAAE